MQRFQAVEPRAGRCGWGLESRGQEAVTRHIGGGGSGDWLSALVSVHAFIEHPWLQGVSSVGQKVQGGHPGAVCQPGTLVLALYCRGVGSGSRKGCRASLRWL